MLQNYNPVNMIIFLVRSDNKNKIYFSKYKVRKQNQFPTGIHPRERGNTRENSLVEITRVLFLFLSVQQQYMKIGQRVNDPCQNQITAPEERPSRSSIHTYIHISYFSCYSDDIKICCLECTNTKREKISL
jgi:hypothetical protein